MNSIVYKLYEDTIIEKSRQISSAPAFILLFVFFIIIFILSFYLKKTFLGRNWQANRCDYIFMSGFLQPDDSIKPHDYTLKNLKYCIKQTIYNETPLLAHMKESFDKIKYLIGFVKKQIGLYESHIKQDVTESTKKYNDIVNNKINYLKYKQRDLNTIYNKLDKEFTLITDKIETGVENKTKLEKENKVNKDYTNDGRYLNYASK